MIACHQQKTLLLLITFFLSFHRQILSYRPQIPNRIFPFFHRRVPVIHLPVTRDWCGDGCGREGDAHALVWWLIILLIPTQSVNLNWLAFDYCNIKQQRCVVGGCASADECLSVSSSCKSSIVRLDPVPNTMCDTTSGWWAEMGTSTEELIAHQQWDFERRPSLTTPPQNRHPLSTEHCEPVNQSLPLDLILIFHTNLRPYSGALLHAVVSFNQNPIHFFTNIQTRMANSARVFWDLCPVVVMQRSTYDGCLVCKIGKLSAASGSSV